MAQNTKAKKKVVKPSNTKDMVEKPVIPAHDVKAADVGRN